MKVAIYTLGCKVNQYETQAMESQLRARGHELIPFDEAADAYIINTCAVTAVSGHKSRQMIRQARKRNGAAVVAVCGCYAQTDPETVAALGVDLIGGTERRMEFLDDLEALMGEKGRSAASKAPGLPPVFDSDPEKAEDGWTGFEDSGKPRVTVGNVMVTKTFEELPAGGLEGRTRAMLKVEDGCVNFCSYCIIPYARGPVRSLPPERAAAQARRLMEEGYREIVLTGIEISSWGRDLKREAGEEPARAPGLADLVEAVCAAAPECRIRLGSLEPRTVTEDFCRRMSSLHNLCPHFHLSLQSGCDETLKRMNRKYDAARYRESVELLRKYYVNPGITTDLIVGFPGETGEEFEQTLKFIRSCRFSAMHIFPYSRRPGTAADRMPGQVPGAVKEARARQAAAAAREMREAYLQSWVGKDLRVLFEEPDPDHPGAFRGHAPNYAEVWAASAENLHNVERTVRILRAEESRLAGEPR